MKNSSLSGVVMVLCAAVLWGTTGTAQSLVAVGLSPYLLGALRLAMAAVFFAVYLVLVPARPAPGAGPLQLPWSPVLLAGACVAVYNLAFFAGIRMSGVAVGTAVAIGSGPVWAGVLQFAVSGRAPRAIWWWGTLLAVAGGSLMVLGGSAAAVDSAANLTGIALCLCAGFTYAAYALINKRLVAHAPPAVVTMRVFTVAAFIAMPVGWAMAGPSDISASAWLVVGYLGVVATGVTYLLFSSGLRHISGATGVTLALAEPMTAFLLAIVVVGERPGVLAFSGLALVLSGLGLVIWAEVRSATRVEVSFGSA